MMFKLVWDHIASLDNTRLKQGDYYSAVYNSMVYVRVSVPGMFL